ncbi:MAG: type II toxin-antitoxin system HicA family toxin [Planctomycetia bacterium]|nr:type II toxin-antitoxin system HicA family toxin [Planctomycetia bacterium]
MKPRKAADIQSALRGKGFREDATHHYMYWFFAQGKKTHIKTFVSHGIKEYGPELLSQVKRQMCLQTGKEFDDFMDCPLTEQLYLQLLIARGKVQLQPPPTVKTKKSK